MKVETVAIRWFREENNVFAHVCVAKLEKGKKKKNISANYPQL